MPAPANGRPRQKPRQGNTSGLRSDFRDCAHLVLRWEKTINAKSQTRCIRRPGRRHAFRRAAATAGDGGFVEDSELQFLARTYYFNRDYRDSPNNAGRNRSKPRSERNGYREEATQGLRLQFASGYTPGSLGFGLDAHAMLGLQLDSGGGRTGIGNLPVGADGHPDHRYGKVGGALRLRHGETRLKYGQTTTSAPVFAASSNRTLAGMAYGLLLEDRSFDGLLLEGGRFTAASGPGESKVRGDISTVYGRLGAYPVRLDAVGFLGGQWQATERLQLSLYASRFDDIWQQAYFGASHRQPLSGSARCGSTSTPTAPATAARAASAASTPWPAPGPGLRTGAAAHHPGLPACPWRAAVRLHGLRRRALQRVHGTRQLGGLLRLQRTGRAFLAITL